VLKTNKNKSYIKLWTLWIGFVMQQMAFKLTDQWRHAILVRVIYFEVMEVFKEVVGIKLDIVL